MLVAIFTSLLFKIEDLLVICCILAIRKIYFEAKLKRYYVGKLSILEKRKRKYNV